MDGFGGSGFTLTAAEKTGRSARLIEYDPIYCETIVASTSQTFDEVDEARNGIVLETAEAAE